MVVDRFTVRLHTEAWNWLNQAEIEMASSVASALESEGLGISPHCDAKPRPGIAAPTATKPRSNGSSPGSWRA